MIFNKKNDFRRLSATLIFLALVFVSLNAAAEVCDCSSDTADPPFLSSGADPNLLLLIDNSASMYDIAYQAEGDHFCYDASYLNSTAYAGYFETATWYAYNAGAGRFEVTEAGGCNGAAGATAYSNEDVCVVIRSTAEVIEGEAVTTLHLDSFKATGNFLNWAAASKFDIEKKILTGGKYNEGVLESEGRGCAGNRYIKQVNISSGATTYKLVLGIRTDYDKNDGIDTTLIDVFQITQNGFTPAKCQVAIDLMMGEDPTGFGQVQQNIIDCMEYDVQNQHQQAGEHDKQALIHSLHDCWYLDKHGSWPGGGAQGFNFENWCSDVYTRDDPRTITSDDEAYVCYGNGNTPELEGFIGECWQPAGVCHNVTCVERAAGDRERCQNGFIEYCTDWNSGKNQCKKETAWVVVKDCDGGAEIARWKTDAEIVAMGKGWSDLDDCIVAARERFCNYIKVPQVVDPSGLQMSTGETWNLPAMLMSQGASGQLGVPIATLEGRVVKADAPSGLLQQYGGKIRIGAMAFNYDGAKSECDKPDPYVTYDCDDPDNRDGAGVVWPIGQEGDLASAVNAVKANSWTPLAEAVYNAIGYYSQRNDLRLDESDFTIGEDVAPITAYCQKNNILLITDGASTADLNAEMTAFAGSTGKDADGTDNANGCGDLYGSTYLDDLAYYAWHEDLFASSPYDSWGVGKPENNIMSFFVFTGKADAGKTGECEPLTLLNNAAANGGTTAAFLADNPDALKTQIEKIFKSVMERAAAGSAASVIAATRSGEGAVYQAIFWPDVIDDDKGLEAKWLGEVHALLVDSNGTFYEDSNDPPNARLDSEDTPVILYLDKTTGRTMACNGTVTSDADGGTCSETPKELHEVKYLWSAARWLGEISNDDITTNRSPYISNQKKRYVFTWNDLDNDGVADADEMLPFVTATDWAKLDWLAAGRDSIPEDFGVATDDDVDQIVNWMRGLDSAAFRKREVTTPENFSMADSPETITWRLGDIVHSTPTAVGRPAEVYHLIYKDSSYADFYNKHQNRRHVIYFGGNDGMLHALNGGFFDAANKRFTRSKDGLNEAAAPELGAELWAYVPYNLLPHLHCLTKPDYLHKYFVDSKPRIFDVNIFTPDADVHINGWGTIMVVGMRFGGSKISSASDGRQFRSAYVVFDITDPENPPKLLGELTYDAASSANMGYTVGIPAVVPMRKVQLQDDGSATVLYNKWYLIIGSGPTDNRPGSTDLKGTSVQEPRIAVFPLNALGGAGASAFRIPSETPGAATAGSIQLPGAGLGFVADPITIDYDIESLNIGGNTVYFGTTEGTWGNWTGKLYRWVAGNIDPSNPEAYDMSAMPTPDQWAAPSIVFNPGKPITSAPSFGTDGFNFWVYFGTGRFYDKLDKTDAGSMAQNTFYGLKEPIKISNDNNDLENRLIFTWATIDGTNALTPEPVETDAPGTRGLIRTDQIVVTKNPLASEAVVSCAAGGCLPVGITKFTELENFIGGTGFARSEGGLPTGYTGTDGWYHNFREVIEKNVGQSTLLGGLVTFTTYEPYDDICKPEGEANLYGLYYRTGTAWHKQVFDPGSNEPRVELGKGLATTPNLHVGREDGAKAFVQTSTGEIVKIDQKNLPLGSVKSGKTKWLND